MPQVSVLLSEAVFAGVLALVFLPNFIADIERKIDLSRQEQNPHMTLHFVAEIIECCFHNKGMEGLPPGRIKTFVRKSGILYADVEMEAKQIHLLSFFESQLALEEKKKRSIEPNGHYCLWTATPFLVGEVFCSYWWGSLHFEHAKNCADVDGYN